MSEIRVGSGQVACALTLLRRLLPFELMVSHYDADQKAWKIDSCYDGFRVADPSRRVVFGKALEHLSEAVQNRRLKPVKKGRGRPRVPGRTTVQYVTTVAIQQYLATLARAAGISKAEMLNYLVTTAHGAYRDKIAKESLPADEDDFEDMTDPLAWMESLRERTTAGDLEKASKRRAREELKKRLEEQSTQIAERIRADIERDHPMPKPPTKEKVSELLELEKRQLEKLEDDYEDED